MILDAPLEGSPKSQIYNVNPDEQLLPYPGVVVLVNGTLLVIQALVSEVKLAIGLVITYIVAVCGGFLLHALVIFNVTV